jgi:hypothetical protein
VTSNGYPCQSLPGAGPDGIERMVSIRLDVVEAGGFWQEMLRGLSAATVWWRVGNEAAV